MHIKNGGYVIDTHETLTYMPLRYFRLKILIS